MKKCNIVISLNLCNMVAFVYINISKLQGEYILKMSMCTYSLYIVSTAYLQYRVCMCLQVKH